MVRSLKSPNTPISALDRYADFSCLDFVNMAGRATDTRPREGEEVRRVCSVSSLPASHQPRLETCWMGFLNSHTRKSMNEISIIPFDFNSYAVRVVMRDGSPWFVAKDICDILHITNSRDAIARLDDDEKGVALTDTLGGKQQVQIVSESGLYILILRCRNAIKPGSTSYRFRKWVTNDVLPAIRKTGHYSIQDPTASDIPHLAESHSAIGGAHQTFVSWINDARRALSQANITAPDLPEMHSDLKLAVLGELLMHTRWMLSINHKFQLTLIPVEGEGRVVSDNEISRLISDPDFPKKYLPEIAKAAIDRMEKSLNKLHLSRTVLPSH